MILNLENIKSITKGALSVGEADGRFFFERFTEEQKSFYRQANERSGVRTEANASIVLDFYTSSESLAFDIEMDQLNYMVSDSMFVDIWEDDIMIAHIGNHCKKFLKVSVNLPLSKGEKRVRIYLPSIFRSTLSELTLDDGATIRATGGRSALILGDSITQGHDVFHPSLSYANTVIRDLELNAVNQAIGGEVFRVGALGSTPLFNPEIITVAYGTNDWVSGINLDEARAYFKKLTELYPTAKIFYISPIWREGGDRVVGGFSFEEACSELKSIAKDAGLILIDGDKIMPHMPKMYGDGLHPNDFGHTQYSKNLLKALAENGVNS